MRAGPSRIAAIDVLRGLAIAGMVIYHLTWDLQAFGVSTIDPIDVTALRWLGNAVAAGFLLLSGLGLSLAEQAGHTWPRRFGRIAALALAAGAVTLVTWLAWPDLAVRFGILDCLVTTNLIALPLRRAPNAVLVAVGTGCLVMPLVWPWPLGPSWAWIGLSHDVPASLDFRPILPWLGLVLFGRAAGRSALIPWLAAAPLRGTASRLAAFAGRHSLPIYLLHQPMLLAVLAALTIVVGADRPAERPILASEAGAFLNACTQACSVKQDAMLCRATCHCVLTASAVPDTGLRGLLAHVQDPQAKLRRAAEACRPIEPAAERAGPSAP